MKAPAFQFYPGDFLSSATVQLMTLAEIGSYILLLSHAWQSDRPGHLPNCENRLRRLAKCTPPQWARSREILLAQFPEDAKDLTWRFNPRLLQEVAKQAIRRQRLAENGRLGGRPREYTISPSQTTDSQKLSNETGLGPEKQMVSTSKPFAKPFNSISSTSSKGEGAAPLPAPARGQAAKFIPPTLEQVQAYAVEAYPHEQAAKAEAGNFFLYYESNSWQVGGKTAMAKWEPSFKLWMQRRPQFLSSSGPNHGPSSTATPARATIAPKAADAFSRLS